MNTALKAIDPKRKAAETAQLFQRSVIVHFSCGAKLHVVCSGGWGCRTFCGVSLCFDSSGSLLSLQICGGIAMAELVVNPIKETKRILRERVCQGKPPSIHGYSQERRYLGFIFNERMELVANS